MKQNHFTGMRGTTNIKRNNGLDYTVRNNREGYFYPYEWTAFFDALKKKQRDRKSVV